jgi:hypothetical protein
MAPRMVAVNVTTFDETDALTMPILVVTLP